MELSWVALGLAGIGFVVVITKGSRMAALQEEVSRLKSVEWSYRELRKDFDGKLATTREHLAAVSQGKKLPADAINTGRAMSEIVSDDDMLADIEKTIAEHPVAIFMKGTPTQPMCGFSATVVGIFNEMGVPYEGVNAIAHPKFRTVLSGFSNWPTLPQVFVGGKLIGGCDIVKEMKESGDLEKVVKDRRRVAAIIAAAGGAAAAVDADGRGGGRRL